jgi:hypothetical protein
MDRRFIRRCCLLFFFFATHPTLLENGLSVHPTLLSSLLLLCNSSDATRKWTVGSSDGALVFTTRKWTIGSSDAVVFFSSSLQLIQRH